MISLAIYAHDADMTRDGCRPASFLCARIYTRYIYIYTRYMHIYIYISQDADPRRYVCVHTRERVFCHHIEHSELSLSPSLSLSLYIYIYATLACILYRLCSARHLARRRNAPATAAATTMGITTCIYRYRERGGREGERESVCVRERERGERVCDGCGHDDGRHHLHTHTRARTHTHSDREMGATTCIYTLYICILNMYIHSERERERKREMSITSCRERGGAAR
jgi:hypothetical protein